MPRQIFLFFRTPSNGLSCAMISYAFSGVPFPPGTNRPPPIDGYLSTNVSGIAGINMSGSPSAVTFKGTIYAFFQGADGSGSLWYVAWNPQTEMDWGTNQPVPNVSMSSSPSALVYNGTLYVFYQGGGNNGSLYYATLSAPGGTWQVNQLVAGAGISSSPSAIVYDGSIYVFYQGRGNSGTLWYSVIGAGTVPGSSQIAGVGMSGSPAAITSATGGYYVYHQGHHDDGLLWRYSSQAGRDGKLIFGVPAQVEFAPIPGQPTAFYPGAPQFKSSHVPAVVVMDTIRFCFYNDSDTGNLSCAYAATPNDPWKSYVLVDGSKQPLNSAMLRGPGVTLYP